MLAIAYAFDKFNDYPFGKRVTAYRSWTFGEYFKETSSSTAREMQGIMIRL